MNKYKLTLKHDNGKHVINTTAKDKDQAINIVCASEGCPPIAVIKVEYLETDLEKAIKPKFYGISNKDLVRRINQAPDFGWDDEGCELERRMNKAMGEFMCEMQGSIIVITKDND